MKPEYNLSTFKSRRSPYAKKLTEQVTLHLDPATFEYFRQKAGEKKVPLETLICLYLQDCRANGRDLDPTWSVSD